MRLFEREREHLGASPPARRVALGATMSGVGLAQFVLGRAQRSRLRGEVGRHPDVCLHLGSGAIGRGLRGLGFAGAGLERRAVGVDAAELLAHTGEIDLDRVRARSQLVELLRRSLEFALGDRDRHDSERVDLRLGRLDLGARRRQRVEVEIDADELRPHACRFRDERLDDSLVGHRSRLPVEAPSPFGYEVHESATALAQRLGAGEHIGDVVLARHCERTFGVEYLRVERTELHPHVLLALREVAARFDALVLSTAQLLDLTAGQVKADRM